KKWAALIIAPDNLYQITAAFCRFFVRFGFTVCLLIDSVRRYSLCFCRVWLQRPPQSHDRALASE
ncbi:hypothetical protein CTZ54_RS25730, partial [Escherichia coli]